MEDLFKHLRPAEPVKVPVGDSAVLTLREATLVQQQRLMSEVKKLDNLGDVLTHFASFFRDADNEGAFMEHLVEMAPRFWASLRKLLGDEFVPAVTAICRAILNTKDDMEKYGYDDAIEDKSVFIRSPKLDAKLQQDLTLLQSSYILKEIWKVNRYVETAGNLVPLTGLMETASQGETPEEPEASED